MEVSIELAGQQVGSNFEPVVFAEIGINHEGSLQVAKEMATAAISAGGRFIKHQTHIPDAEMSREANLTVPGNASESIFEIMQRCSLSESEESELARHVRQLGGVFFSTPFSREAVERLEKIDTPFYKIGSGECNNYPLVEYVASKGKPVVLSTGMNNLTSVGKAVEILKRNRVPFALLHTTNLYPTPAKLLRLESMRQLQESFKAPVGLSDHSTSNYACISSVVLGASILERHFTDSKSRTGPDIICSMDPEELAELLQASKEVFQARGGSKEMAEDEAITARFAFSSVAIIRNVEAGEVLTSENSFPIRPGTGPYGPEDYYELLGREVKRSIPARTQLQPDHLLQPLPTSRKPI